MGFSRSQTRRGLGGRRRRSGDGTKARALHLVRWRGNDFGGGNDGIGGGSHGIGFPGPPLCPPAQRGGRGMPALAGREHLECISHVDMLRMSKPQNLADSGFDLQFTVRQCDAVILDDRAWRAKYGGGPRRGAPGVQPCTGESVQEELTTE
jgi:hypothetical protein